MHPNKRGETRQKKYSDKTPDSKTKGVFKPRFIVKEIQEPASLINKRVGQSFN